MMHIKKQIIILIAVLYVVFSAGVPGYADDPSVVSYKAFTLPPLPDWTDKYSDTDKGDMSYFKMSALVDKLKLTRLQAVELQNHFRDLTAAGEASDKAFNEALKRVRANKFESMLDPAGLECAPFIVAIDVDETLLQQYYTMWKQGSKYYDYKITFESGERGISMAPGWQVLLKTIKKLGGMVVIYSANTDETIWKIARTVNIGDKKLYQYVDGVLANSYLILQGKNEWVPAGKTGDPVAVPSKDLQFLDKTLSKVIIIDDNPKRIIQNVRLRLPKKYQADLYYSDKLAAGAYDRQLPAIAAEIEESAEYAGKNRIPFAMAYLPYTQLGSVALHWLVETGTFNRAQAIEYIRKNPAFVDEAF
jgi:hypothetical protein